MVCSKLSLMGQIQSMTYFHEAYKLKMIFIFYRAVKKKQEYVTETRWSTKSINIY